MSTFSSDSAKTKSQLIEIYKTVGLNTGIYGGKDMNQIKKQILAKRREKSQKKQKIKQNFKMCDIVYGFDYRNYMGDRLGALARIPIILAKVVGFTKTGNPKVSEFQSQETRQYNENRISKTVKFINKPSGKIHIIRHGKLEGPGINFAGRRFWIKNLKTDVDWDKIHTENKYY